MESELLKYLLPAFVALATACVGLLTVYVNILKTKASKELEKLTNEEDRAFAESVLENVNDTILAVVNQTAQTFVDGLKSKSEDGKLTKEDAVNVFNYALSQVKLLLGTEGYANLQKIKPNADAWLTAKIESFTRLSKLTDTSTKSETTTTTVNYSVPIEVRDDFDVTKLEPKAHATNVNSVATSISDELHKELTRNLTIS
jgi:hypothetical protein